MADILLRLSFRSLHYSSSSPPPLLMSQFPSSFLIFTQTALSPTRKNSNSNICSSFTSTSSGLLYSLVLKIQQPKRLISGKVHATIAETDGPKWWERVAGPNMIDIHSTQDFLNALSQAGDKLVIVEFYGTWCGSCRALFPKLCKIAEEHPEILFLKVNFDENKPMCKSLNVKVLPFFHFYRGADGMLESFSCSLAKLQKLKDAIATHNTARCSIGPPKGVGDVKLNESSPAHKDKPVQDS